MKLVAAGPRDRPAVRFPAGPRRCGGGGRRLLAGVGCGSGGAGERRGRDLPSAPKRNSQAGQSNRGQPP